MLIQLAGGFKSNVVQPLRLELSRINKDKFERRKYYDISSEDLKEVLKMEIQ